MRFTLLGMLKFISVFSTVSFTNLLTTAPEKTSMAKTALPTLLFALNPPPIKNTGVPTVSASDVFTRPNRGSDQLYPSSLI
jgi:hypothetical protein